MTAMRKKVLVFPCGSEIGLEIFRALRYSTHFELIGGSSVDDHGRFVYPDYIGGIPFISDESIIPELNRIVVQRGIDAIYPAMDSVLALLRRHENELGCRIVTSCAETVELCLSKKKTYAALHGLIRTPQVYAADAIPAYPVFAKPDVGYGARGARVLRDENALREQLQQVPSSIFCELLGGEEYTVDCFTDRHGVLRFWGPRLRGRIGNGISVNTVPVARTTEFERIVSAINAAVPFRGAWFVQLKRTVPGGELCLLEMAARFGGSSGLFRNKGVNFAALSLFDAFDMDVQILENHYDIELDRALDDVYRIGVDYDTVYVDFDDCVILDRSRVNTELIGFLYHCLNRGRRLVLLTRHAEDIDAELCRFRLSALFDKVVHLTSNEPKSRYIDSSRAIFIDDSHAERTDVALRCGIPVFSPDMVKSLFCE